jgi:NSS family neurotransmitter:Na+ symporter
MLNTNIERVQHQHQRETFSGRWGLVLAALGSAVGLGNIWRFPMLAGTHGGGAFLIPYVIFMFSWAVPLLITEFSLGKKTRLGTIATFGTFVSKKYVWMGAWMVIVSMFVGFYYAVVMGWTLKYFTISFSGGITPTEDTLSIWNAFLSSPLQVVFFQLFAIAVCTYIVYRGIAKGIERWNKILMPILIGLLIFLAIWALCLPGAINGLRYLFVPTGEYVGRSSTWLVALGQVAFSTSAGFGMGITYASYMKRKEDTTLNAFLTCFGDTSIAFLAGIAVICAVFALSGGVNAAMASLSGESVPVIAFPFIYLTKLFGTIPGGWFIGSIFFICMAFAALTSLISTFEIAVRNFIDFGWARSRAIILIGAVTLIAGIPSAMVVANITTPAGISYLAPIVLQNQMMVWDLGLIISGLFVAFAVWKFGPGRFRTELINTGYNDIYIGKWWEFVILYLFPLQFIGLIGWTIYESARTPTVFLTLVIQLFILLLFLLKLNKWFGNKLHPLYP